MKASGNSSDANAPVVDESREECFVIMPITDGDGYVQGHFKHVFDDIIAPACDIAGYKAIRADHVKETNLIHLDILQKLLHSPIALCDLSSLNPNVLFELALRQAFDGPVVLIQERGTKQIFDIGPLRFTEYRRERLYHEVLEDQKEIALVIRNTVAAFKEKKGINSIVRLLSLSEPAKLPQESKAGRQDDMLRLLMEEVGQLRSEVRKLAQPVQSEHFIPEPWRKAVRDRKNDRLRVTTDRAFSALAQAEDMLTELRVSSDQLLKNPDCLIEYEQRLRIIESLLAEAEVTGRHPALSARLRDQYFGLRSRLKQVKESHA